MYSIMQRDKRKVYLFIMRNKKGLFAFSKKKKEKRKRKKKGLFGSKLKTQTLEKLYGPHT